MDRLSRQSFIRQGLLPEKKCQIFVWLPRCAWTNKETARKIDCKCASFMRGTTSVSSTTVSTTGKLKLLFINISFYSVTSDKNIDFDPYRISPFQFRCKVHFYRKLVSWLLYKEHNITWKTRAE